MKVPLIRSRLLNHNDVVDTSSHQISRMSGISTVAINQTLADVSRPGADPVGKTFRRAPPDMPRVYQAVGIIGGIRNQAYRQTIRPKFYHHCQKFDLSGSGPTYWIRTTEVSASVVPSIRRTLPTAEPAMRTPKIITVPQTLYKSTQSYRISATCFMTMTGLGLFLAALSLYGVLAYSVASAPAKSASVWLSSPTAATLLEWLSRRAFVPRACEPESACSRDSGSHSFYNITLPSESDRSHAPPCRDR
ncbi:MAG: hypothetical protein M2R45_03233 [Verrucomicrobia subdivision 3 bacterium]|nr:hypothetical protein [Limisphaerales bacterium]MCS1416094.1 hypothetical protein [Limisphaerales bacterium]